MVDKILAIKRESESRVHVTIAEYLKVTYNHVQHVLLSHRFLHVQLRIARRDTYNFVISDEVTFRLKKASFNYEN